ncbi:hypothetical protein SAY87_004952 [Trapa incisa]|uniref:Poly [ADP-ribose] polymerase n=1 Tax=Trapa incisa TaxID=236973 RepID=A0AAN7JPL5_9MYRT|nr:hypothetical protein SAY87_004952 [Trapa incisa]
MAAQRMGEPVESVQVSFPASRKPSICRDCDRSHRHGISVDNQDNFQRTGPPARVMYYFQGSWVDIPIRVVESLRSSFVQRRPVVVVPIHGSRYVFDFLRMVQTEFETGNQRSIAWIDDAKCCFFPRRFVEEIEERSLKRKREDLNEKLEDDEAEVSSSNDKQEAESKRRCLVPSTNDQEKSPWANVRLLEEGSKLYFRIKNSFLPALKSMSSFAPITGIHRCEWRGDLGLARFEVFQKKAEIVKAMRGASNTVYAWLGTSKKGLDSILARGFSSPININESGNYGVGVYFSSMEFPHLSATRSELDDNGEKHVILCRVILGSVEKVEFGSKQSHPSSVNFDTGVDDPRNPKWYVVWPFNMNTHVLPEFILSFKSSDGSKGSTGPSRGAACQKRSIVELFSKIRNALPPVKAQEVQNLYSVFRAGHLAKDLFAKKLRSITGDDVLLSMIREIRSSE